MRSVVVINHYLQVKEEAAKIQVEKKELKMKHLLPCGRCRGEKKGVFVYSSEKRSLSQARPI